MHDEKRAAPAHAALPGLIATLHTIADEIEYDALLGVLLPALIEHSGAMSSAVLLPDAAQWLVAAHFSRGDAAVTLTPPIAPADLGIAVPLVKAAAHQRKPQLLISRTTLGPTEQNLPSGPVSEDAVLCLPLVRREALLGVLYLAQRAATGFTQGQVAAAKVLARHAASALSHAQRLQQLEAQSGQQVMALQKAIRCPQPDADCPMYIHKQLHEHNMLLSTVSDNLPHGVIYQLVFPPNSQPYYSCISNDATVLQPDKEWRILEYLACPITPHLHQFILREVTERRRAEEALQRAHANLEQRVQERTAELMRANRELQVVMHARQRSEERYRILVETSPHAILLTDLQGWIQFCNQQAAQLFEYGHMGQMLGCSVADLLAPDPSAVDQLADLLAPLPCHSVEYLMRKRSGSHFYAEISRSLVADTEGKPVLLTIVVHDVHWRKEVEQALTAAYNELAVLNRHLSDNRNLLQALLDGLADGLLLLDQQGRVQVANRPLANLVGSTPREMVGQTWATLFPRLAPRFPGHLVAQIDALGRRHLERVRYSVQDGTTCILDLHVFALSSTTDQVEYTVLHVVDVTETYRLQAQVIENERFAASARLAASVAHEINTPLQTIQTNLKLLRLTNGADQQMFLKDALDEIQRVGRTVRQLLDLYRPVAATYGPVDLPALIDRILLLLRQRIFNQRVIVECDLNTTNVPFHGRADELTQVLLNLIVNALDAMPQGGTLRVQTAVYPLEAACGTAEPPLQICPQVVITISDTGQGIDPELQERIFDAFVTTKEEGTGLGLSICRQLVEQHGGILSVSSRRNQGSTFTVALPIGSISHSNSANKV